MEKIVLIGNGGHARSIFDSIEAVSIYEVVGFVSDCEDSQFEYRGCRIIGSDDDLERIYESGIHTAFICIGYMGTGNVRERLHGKLKEIGYDIPSIIDPTAIIAQDVCIGEGTYVGKRAVINSGSVIGKMAIINTGAIIEHDNCVGDFTHIAVNATLCGDVSVGRHCFIGAGVTIIQELTIGGDSVIGAGSIVLKSVGTRQKVYGIVSGEGYKK